MIFDEMLKVVHFLTQIKIMKNIKDDINIPELERKKGIEIGEKISICLGIKFEISLNFPMLFFIIQAPCLYLLYAGGSKKFPIIFFTTINLFFII